MNKVRDGCNDIPPAFFTIRQRHGIRVIRECSAELFEAGKDVLLNRQFGNKVWRWLMTYYKTETGSIENYPIPMLYKTRAERVLNAHIRDLPIPTCNDVAKMKKRVECAVDAKINWSRDVYTNKRPYPVGQDVFSLFTRLTQVINDRELTQGDEQIKLRLESLRLMQEIIRISNYNGDVLTERDLH